MRKLLACLLAIALCICSLSVASADETGRTEGPDDSMERTNIAFGKFYVVEGGKSRTDEFGDETVSRGLTGKLTDGVIPENGWKETIAAYTGSNDYVITVDLNGEGWIYEASIGFFGGQRGVVKPENISVTYAALSDGEYIDLGEALPVKGETKDNWEYCAFALDHAPVKATTIRLSIHIEGDTTLWMTEITVEGYMLPEEEAEHESVKVYIDTESIPISKSEYVPCSIRIIDPSGEYEDIEDDNATITIRGNSTAQGKKAPYNIKFEKKQNVLGMGKCKKWYLLANMYDKSLLRNKLSYDFAADTGLAYTQQSTFCDVYLNGEYVGNYQICESIGVGKSRVDIDVEDNEYLFEFERYLGYSTTSYFETDRYHVRLGFDDPSDPTAEQMAWVKDFMSKAEDALATGDREQIEAYWDIDSFVNDYIVHEYFKCVDAQTGSARYYIEDGKIHGGPVWDFDLSSGNADTGIYGGYFKYGGDSTQGWWGRGLWYRYFFETDWFEDMCAERYRELQPVIENIYMANELGESRIDSLLAEFGGDFARNYEVWNVARKDSKFERGALPDFDAAILFLRSWLAGRNEWMKEQWGVE